MERGINVFRQEVVLDGDSNVYLTNDLMFNKELPDKFNKEMQRLLLLPIEDIADEFKKAEFGWDHYDVTHIPMLALYNCEMLSNENVNEVTDVDFLKARTMKYIREGA